jgi:hypothetical protein
LTRNRLKQFLNEIDGNEKYRREGLRKRVFERLRNNVTDGKNTAIPSTPKPFVKLKKEEIKINQMKERNEIARKRAEKPISFAHENVYNYLVGYDTNESTKLDKDVGISDDAKKIERKAKQAKAKSNAAKIVKTAKPPQQKKQKTEAAAGKEKAPRKQSDHTIEKNRLLSKHDISTIRIGTIIPLVGGEDRQLFIDHLLKCINKIREIRTNIREEAEKLLTAFFAEFDDVLYTSLPQLVEKIREFAIEFIEKNCPAGSLREKRLKSVRGIGAKKEAEQVEQELDETEAVETNTKDGKRKRGSEKSAESTSGVKDEDALEALKDIVGSIFFKTFIYVSLLSI